MTRYSSLSNLAYRTNAKAAALLRLSLPGFHKQIYGERAVSPQTARLAELIEKHKERK